MICCMCPSVQPRILAIADGNCWVQLRTQPWGRLWSTLISEAPAMTVLPSANTQVGSQAVTRLKDTVLLCHHCCPQQVHMT